MPGLWYGGMRACNVVAWNVQGKIAYREKALLGGYAFLKYT